MNRQRRDRQPTNRFTYEELGGDSKRQFLNDTRLESPVNKAWGGNHPHWPTQEDQRGGEDVDDDSIQSPDNEQEEVFYPSNDERSQSQRKEGWRWFTKQVDSDCINLIPRVLLIIACLGCHSCSSPPECVYYYDWHDVPIVAAMLRLDASIGCIAKSSSLLHVASSRE